MLYRLGLPLLRFVLFQYFRQISRRGAELVETGPLLVVSNHPNFLFDPLLVATLYKRELWFLAKSTVFRGPVLSEFLKQAHLVPIFRRQDDPSQMTKNEETFKFTTSALREGRGVVIFPEGVSMGERRLQPLKTGAARMALQAEAASDFALGLKIQPIGITYTDLRQFQSSVTIMVGQPIPVRKFKDQYAANALKSAGDLTQEIETGLREVTVEVKDAEHEDLVVKIGKVYASRGTAIDDHARLKLIAENVEALSPSLERREALERKLGTFQALSDLWGLDSAFPLNQRADSFFLLLAAPLILLGAAVHTTPYRLIEQLTPKISKHPADSATVKMTLGVVIFPGWSLIVAVLIGLLARSLCFTLVSFVLLIASAHYVNKYLMSLRLLLVSYLWPGHKKPHQVLAMVRDELIQELEELRVK